jgi:thioesterase domain-containing protein/acyl carrier protein
VEIRLAELWRQLLGVERVGRGDDFFNLGGNSLLATDLFTQIEKEFGCSLPLSVLIEHATLAGLAGLIKATPSTSAGTLLVPMQPMGTKPPIFLAPGGLGAILYLRDLVRHLGNDHPIYGLQSVKPDLRSQGLIQAADLARRYLREMRDIHPVGPYILFGHSSGGIIVYEMACQLRQAGGQIAMLGLFDTFLPGTRPRASARERMLIHWRNFTGAGGLRQRAAYLFSRMRRLLVNSIRSTPLLDGAARAGLIAGDHMTVSELLLDTYRPAYYDGTLTIFRAAKRSPYERSDPLLAWKDYVRKIELIDVPGDHWSLLSEPHVGELASRMRRRLEALDGSA